MARPQTFSKKENEKKKQARRLEKQNRKEERKLSGNTNSFEDMIAYVDENGRITSTPPETNHKKEEINHEEIVISTPRQESPEVRKGRVWGKNRSHEHAPDNARTAVRRSSSCADGRAA